MTAATPVNEAGGPVVILGLETLTSSNKLFKELFGVSLILSVDGTSPIG